MYTMIVRPMITYGAVGWHSRTELATTKKTLEKVSAPGKSLHNRSNEVNSNSSTRGYFVSITSTHYGEENCLGSTFQVGEGRF